MAFLIDVTQHVSKSNGQLPGKNQLANKIFEHIISFQKKLELFKGQLNMSIVTHFPCLKIQYHGDHDINYQKYSTVTDKLSVVLDARF